MSVGFMEGFSLRAWGPHTLGVGASWLGADAMSTHVRYLAPEHPIVEMVTYGHFSVEDAWAAVDAGAVVCVEHDVWNALSDMSGTTQTPSPSGVVRFAEELSKRGLPTRYRQAIVRPTDTIAATWIDLYATAAVNRGLTVRVFRDRDQAIAWLEGGTD
jgi:hypothetical protein